MSIYCALLYFVIGTFTVLFLNTVLMYDVLIEFLRPIQENKQLILRKKATNFIYYYCIPDNENSFMSCYLIL